MCTTADALMGLMAVSQKPGTSIPFKAHAHDPYLLRDLAINSCNQVWCADITYLPVSKGYLYLAAIMDWYSPEVLAWRVSNTMDADICVSALKKPSGAMAGR